MTNSSIFTNTCLRRLLLDKRLSGKLPSWVASVSFNTIGADEKDIELAYTTYPSQSQEDQVDKAKRPLLLLHGLFGARGNLHSIAKRLSHEGRKIIPYDCRNHGDSQHHPDMNYSVMAEDLLGLVEDLKLDRPVALGHSMGGKSAMVAALTKPEVFSGLVVADVAPQPSPNQSLMKTYAQAMRDVKISDDISVAKARTQARLQLASVVEDRGVLEFLLTNLREFEDKKIRWRVNLDSLINNMDQLFEMLALDSKPFTKPTLFVFGAKSEHYINADLGVIKALFPSVQIEVIPDAGHFLHADKPLEFVNIVDSFLKDLDVKSS